MGSCRQGICRARRFAVTIALVIAAQVVSGLPGAGMTQAWETPRLQSERPRLGLRPDGTPGARTVEAVRGLFESDENFRQYFAPALASAEEGLKPAGEERRRRGGPLGYAAAWVATGDNRFAQAAISRLREDNISITAKSSYYSNVWDFALAYDWLYHHPLMTDEVRRAVEDRIAATVAEELVELDGSYPAVWHGRNQLANNTLVAALSLSLHPRAEELQRRAMVHYADAVRALAMTEGWPEGPSYWMYNRHFPYALAADCFMTSTGEHSIGGIDIRETIRKVAYWHLYAMRPDGTLARFGDSYTQGPANTPLWQPVQDYYARITGDPGVVASADYFRLFNENPYHRGRYAWSTVLTYDPHLPMPEGYDPQKPADYLNTHLPRARLFGRATMGQAFFIDRWGDPDATWIAFKAGDVLAHHGHYDQGNFVIYRGSPLAVHSGYYADYYSDFRLGYFIQTIAVNSLLVEAPGEFSNYARRRGGLEEVTGGQRVMIPTGVDLTSVDEWLSNQHAGVHYEAGDILAFESAPELFDYVAADITEAYNSTRYASPGNPAKVSSVVRRLLHLRQSHAVIVLDNVVTTDPSYTTRWLLHTPAKPVTETEERVEGDADNGILRTGDRWLQTSYEKGRLFHQVLLPEDPEVLKIGGPDYRHYVRLSSGARNLEPSERRREMPPEYGVWRTEVLGVASRSEHVFLNVLWPRLADEPAPTPARLASVEPSALVVTLDGWAVVMRTEGKFGSFVEYEAPEETKHHLVVDLEPRSAWLATIGAETRQGVASDDGVLSFEAGAGRVAATEVPPRNGSGHM